MARLGHAKSLMSLTDPFLATIYMYVIKSVIIVVIIVLLADQ